MTRQEKYPETSTFHYYNANPKNKITTDCVIRALCVGMTKTYEEVYRGLMETSLRTGYHLDDVKCFEKYLQENGWIKNKQPRKVDNTKYTGKEFCQKLNETAKRYANYIANIGGHHIVAIVDGKVNDIWDSTDGCIGNYWTKAK